MKNIILLILDAITLPLAWIFTENISCRISNLKHNFLASLKRHHFKNAGRFKIGGLPVHILGAKYIEVGDNCEFFFHARIHAVDSFCGEKFTPKLIFGKNVIVNSFCHIGCINKVSIGDFTTMGARVYITDHTHGDTSYEDLSLPPRHRKLVSKGPVVIGKYVHIGENSCVMPGVTIGDHAVIGSNSVVTKDIPPYGIAVGCPAKVIKINDAK